MPRGVYQRKSIEEKFWQKVKKTEKCWEWSAHKNKDGYGRFLCFGMQQQAHRISWYLKTGTLPSELVLHKCDNPACVNPDHLFLGDQKANMVDKVSKQRQFIPNGETNSQSKLDAQKVLEIKKLISAGSSTVQIAKMFQVSPSTISDIKYKRCWKHL